MDSQDDDAVKKIAVIGSGANGLATAAYLSQQGHSVTLCDTKEQLSELPRLELDGIRLCGAFSDCGEPIYPEKVTDQIGKAVENAEMVIVCVSAERHEEIGNEIKDCLHAGQTVLFNPGNLGAVVLSRQNPELLAVPGLILAELCGCLWACRITGDTEVTIALPLSKKRLAAWPTERLPEAVQRISELFPVMPATNVVEAAVNSPNVITHLCGTLFNVAPVEQRGEEFAFFREGMSETVVRMFSKLEKERNAVLEKAGMQIYEPSSEAFMRILMDDSIAPQFDVFRSLKGPSSMKHRYLSEDAFCGVSLLISLARHYRVPVPLTESFLTIASAVNERNYYEEGYTLQNLGLMPS